MTAPNAVKPTGGRLHYGLRLSLFLRSLSLQASWNQQRMQNLGLLTTVLPWLRRQPREITADRLFCRRYYEFFNTNPYLANFLIGGLIRLEDDRNSGQLVPPGQIAMFRDTLGRAFASLGDQLVWLALRPALTLALCLAALLGGIYSVLATVACFALGQLALRWFALGKGYAMGLEIVELLSLPHWHRIIGTLKRVGMVLAGAVLAAIPFLHLDSGPHAGDGRQMLGFGLGLLVGSGLPRLVRKRLPGEGLLLVAVAISVGLTFAI